MIVIDFQHLSYRNLHTCFYSCKPKKRDGKFITEDFIGIYFHQMLTSLHYIQMGFKEYGEIVIALDGFKNWRKELLQDFYKAERSSKRAESEINFNEFFEYQKELEEFLKGLVKVIKVDEAEADDIGYVLAHHSKEKTLLITSDKDWKQHLIYNHNVDFYDPMKRLLIKNSEELQKELKFFRIIHILIGDKADGIPNIMYNASLTDEFKKFLNNKEYHYKDLEKIEFEGEKFKTIRFGEKTAEKFVKNPHKFIKDKNLIKSKVYDNFRMNRKLVDSRKIPKEIQEKIIKEFKKTKINEHKLDFINKYNLHRCKSYKIGKDLDCIDYSYEDFGLNFSGF